jgi:hypothetical protein
MKSKFYATLLLAGITASGIIRAQETNTSLGESSFPLREPRQSQFNTAIGFASMSVNTTGGWNTAVGANSMQFNETGMDNVAVGISSLGLNRWGSENTAIGAGSLAINVGGRANTAVGYRTLRNNANSFNSALGHDALEANSSGQSNTAVGYRSLYLSEIFSGNTAVGSNTLQNPGGSFNVALGFQAAANASNAQYITAVGADALFQTRAPNNTAVGGRASAFNTTGTDNVAVGFSALRQNTTGSRNVAIGANTGAASTNITDGTFVGANAQGNANAFFNVTALGANAVVTANNQVRLGNSTVTSIGGAVAWTSFSDGRIKENIRENVIGLEFINKLRPVTYVVSSSKLNQLLGTKAPVGNTSTEKRQTGFIAQDVAKIAEELQFEFSGVDAPKNDKDLYGLRYAEFVVPLVKATQELSKQVQDLTQLVQEQQEQIQELKRNIGAATGKPGAWIKQNTPNPVTSATTIEYFIPNEVRAARILVTNAKGQQLKVYNVSGSGTVQFNAGTLPAGTYTYSLVADGRTISAKKLVVVLR